MSLLLKRAADKVNMHNGGFLIHLINDCIPFPKNELVIFSIREIIPTLTVLILLTLLALLTVLTLLTVQYC